jgi:hypothetical protein
LRLRAAASCLVVSCLCDPARAAEPIDTDGPDFVESSEVVGHGRLQFEANLAREHAARDAGHQTTTSTPTLLRLGVAQALELRLETEGRVEVRNDDSTQTGQADVALGIKWHSQDRDPTAGIPALSWILHFDAPTGSSELRGRGIRPSLRAVATWDLPDDFALSVMPGIKLGTTPNGERFVSGIFGAALNRRWTERFRTFVEVAAPQITTNRYGGTSLSWSLGAAYLINNDWQLGVRAAAAATRAAPSGQLLFELAGRY